MPRRIIDKNGRIVKEGDPNPNKVRIDNLEDTVSELLKALVDAQHRIAELDGGDLPWPGDTYEPMGANPAT